MTSPSQFPPGARVRALRLGGGIALAWSVVAVLLSVQGWLASASTVRAQAWWPSLGYSLAIFSVWAALTAPILLAVRRIEGSRLSLSLRLGGYALGLVAVSVLHVGLFVLAYWPIYGSGLPSRWAMGERMFVRNLGTNVLFYAAIVAVGLRVTHRVAPLTAAPDVLRARSRGAVRLVPVAEIDWIGAAGNYAEAHTAAGAVLLDESLASLAARLPADSFARIHRGAIVRLDRIAEVRSLGRGDAELVLRSRVALRLSRRYRGALSAWLNGA